MVAPAGVPGADPSSEITTPVTRGHHGVRHIPGDPKISSFALLMRGPICMEMLHGTRAEVSFIPQRIPLSL